MGITEKLGKMGIPGFRSGKKWKMAVAVFGYFWIFIILLALISPSPAPSASTKSSAPVQTPTPTTSAMTTVATAAPIQTSTPTVTATPAATWREIMRWEGKSIKNTETFTIPSSAKEWKISWDTKPGDYGAMNFQIYVYKTDGSLVTVAANVIGADKDSSIMRGAGDYYLSINSAQLYTIIVEAK